MDSLPIIQIGKPPHIDVKTDVLIIGAGACGLTAGLKANSLKNEVVIIEKDTFPSGSTSMSSGFIPASNTSFQKRVGIKDSFEIFSEDILRKSNYKADKIIVNKAVETIKIAIDWLEDNVGMEWIVLEDFLYPGHSVHRMHSVPEKTGSALHSRFLNAVKLANIPLVTGATAKSLYLDEEKIIAVKIERLNKFTEIIGCKSLILACNGFGGNTKLVSKFIPKISNGLYYGHRGNTGDAVLWGQALGAKLKDLSGYQGHGSFSVPYSIPITWALMTEGGIQLNIEGKRFSNEHFGYSEQAEKVLSQPEGIAWNIYDQSRHEFAINGFPEYRSAYKVGAIKNAKSIIELAQVTKISEFQLKSTLSNVQSLYVSGIDNFGRDFKSKNPLIPPYYAVKVTGALFHTQGGLVINELGQVLRNNGQLFPNLFAGGGAACGISGSDASGYLSGNGLLTAVAFGYLAGMNASRLKK